MFNNQNDEDDDNNSENYDETDGETDESDDDGEQWTFRELRPLVSFIQTRDVELDTLLAQNNRITRARCGELSSEKSWFQKICNIPQQVLTCFRREVDTLADDPIIQFFVFFIWFIIVFRGIYQINTL